MDIELAMAFLEGRITIEQYMADFPSKKSEKVLTPKDEQSDTGLQNIHRSLTPK